MHQKRKANPLYASRDVKRFRLGYQDAHPNTAANGEHDHGEDIDYFCRQCVLKRGDWHQIAWIPEKYAVLNKYLKIEKEDGWQVINIGGRKSHIDVNERSRDHLRQREGSDI